MDLPFCAGRLYKLATAKNKTVKLLITTLWKGKKKETLVSPEMLFIMDGWQFAGRAVEGNIQRGFYIADLVE